MVPSPRMKILFALPAFVIALLFLLPSLSSYDFFHRDEANWIITGRTSFRTFFIDHDFDAPYWSAPMNSFGRYNPQIGKYLIGASLWLRGEREGRKDVVRWNPKRSLAWHIREGIAPAPAELAAARIPAVLLGAFAVAALVLMVLTVEGGVAGVIGGYAAAAVFLANPVVRNGARRAMLDIPALAFSLAAILFTEAAFDSFRTRREGRGFALAAAGSLFAGIALSTKLNAGMIVAVVAAANLVLLAARRNRRAAMALTVTYILPPLVFVGHNPYLWHHTIDGIRAMLHFGTAVSQRTTIYPDEALLTWTDRWGTLFRMVFPPPALIVPAAVGLAALLRERKRHVALLLWSTLVPVAVAAWTPLAWGRYYTPAIAAGAFLAGYGIAVTAVVAFPRAENRADLDQS